MIESVEKSVKVKCIEKNILAFIFGKNGFEEDKYTEKIHYKVSDQIKSDFGTFVSSDEIDGVLYRLIDEKYIYSNPEKKLYVSPSGIRYSVENDYFKMLDVIDYCNSLNRRQMDYFLGQMRNIEELRDNLTEQKDDMNINISDLNNKISSFYNNIVSILALLIAAFSIIGFNISGIKFIVSNTEVLSIKEYTISILVINISIVVSLFAVFYLVQKVTNPERSWFKSKRSQEKEMPISKIKLLNNRTFQIFLVTCNFIMIIGIFIYFSYPFIIKIFSNILKK